MPQVILNAPLCTLLNRYLCSYWVCIQDIVCLLNFTPTVCMSVYMYVLHIFCVVHVCMNVCTVVCLYNAVETP